MNRSDQPNTSNESISKQRQRSFSEAIDLANRVIERSQAEIARSRASGQSVADTIREISQIVEDENDASRTAV
jgi:bacillopeptidase F (M6 metalloprotease family)